MLLAASDLSRFINGLETHHTDEMEPFLDAAAQLTSDEAAMAQPFTDNRPLGEHMPRLGAIARGLRDDRGELVAKLEVLRDPLVDLIAEANSLLPEGVALRYVDPPALEPAPSPLRGVDLQPVEKLSVLLQTLQWSQRISRHLAVEALGPCYLLWRLIEWPSQEAASLHDQLGAALEGLKGFIYRPS